MGRSQPTCMGGSGSLWGAGPSFTLQSQLDICPYLSHLFYLVIISFIFPFILLLAYSNCQIYEFLKFPSLAAFLLCILYFLLPWPSLYLSRLNYLFSVVTVKLKTLDWYFIQDIFLRSNMLHMHLTSEGYIIHFIKKHAINYLKVIFSSTRLIFPKSSL